MSDAATERRYLVLLRFQPQDRAIATKWAMEQIQSFATEECRLAFSSERGETFGVFMKSRKAANQIRSALVRQYLVGNRTFVMVLEVGDDWSGAGNSRAWEWLQHH